MPANVYVIVTEVSVSLNADRADETGSGQRAVFQIRVNPLNPPDPRSKKDSGISS